MLLRERTVSGRVECVCVCKQGQDTLMLETGRTTHFLHVRKMRGTTTSLCRTL